MQPLRLKRRRCKVWTRRTTTASTIALGKSDETGNANHCWGLETLLTEKRTRQTVRGVPVR
eukprot:3126601-Rhodomonas_salina.2